MKSLLNLPYRLRKKIQRETRNLSHVKFEEPIVVFESDDWGMERKPASHVIQKFAEPGEWADEQTESIEDLRSYMKPSPGIVMLMNVQLALPLTSSWPILISIASKRIHFSTTMT